MRKFTFLLVGLVLALAFATTARRAVAQNVDLMANLTGAAEVPDPGDPDGVGAAAIIYNSDTQLCFGLSVSAITLPAAAAHIHEGAAGVAGPVVVPLAPPDAEGSASGCVDVEASLASAIRSNPGNYYVNVHTSDFPAGAVRGQLAQGDGSAAPTPMPVAGATDNAPLMIAAVAILVLAAGAGITFTARRRTRL